MTRRQQNGAVIIAACIYVLTMIGVSALLAYNRRHRVAFIPPPAFCYYEPDTGLSEVCSRSQAPVQFDI